MSIVYAVDSVRDSTIEIKASLEGINQIRRFKYQSSTFSFAVLYQTIENFFRRGNKEESYVVQYRDVDNDLITLSSDQEFSYAVECLKFSISIHQMKYFALCICLN
jgi:hypothetical protein